MQLEVGKIYRDGRGNIEKIVEFRRGEKYPYYTNIGFTYKEDGSHSLKTLDLIEEITENTPETPSTSTLVTLLRELKDTDLDKIMDIILSIQKVRTFERDIDTLERGLS